MNRSEAAIDVLILGAGPAGTATAIQCAQAGLNVTMIEREQFPRDRPGETLHPGIEPLLQQLSVAEQTLTPDLLRHLGIWVQWNQSQFVPFGKDDTGVWRGFQIWRADFDAALLNHAKKLGVKVLQPCCPQALLLSNNRVTGVKTSQGALHTTYVVDATGSHHWLARQLKLPITHYTPRLIARYGYAVGEIPQHTPAIAADNQGWTWTARVRPQLYQWTRLLFYQEQIDKHWIPPEFTQLQPISTNAADVTWRIVEHPAGNGYFLVGDAAAVLDPAASHGILKAIMSGMMAGHAIAQIINHDQLESVAIQAYNRWLHNWFQHDIQKLKEFYTTLPNPPQWL
ncbi:NAD(P)/FAD-dependent oxidoreductase [Gloeocapsopsis dulcis]|uniref:FAD-dependent oxidoreductase n=1 Tax=Gloeocapsopsis dulcis AAB1 = 1H9 TaxID=1433147 RepID=A0A6N8FNP4_9CHRO|nr:NAD(P)/FAD-dependent oxidoreductase [Gloeocapsopsis dulcis]MUL35010.1 FAD-dependent oxidoreductase [Gloeocapsopsis dulcis AAB1 = 1H9]WNN89915.1 NAD(P)/FAD-dependent oxidoreductase [Gloeocapsopsis dulcis]